jgi:hypothetical protein
VNEVSAGGVYEAVVQALRIFRDNEWVDNIGHGQTPIVVRIKGPEIEHTLMLLVFSITRPSVDVQDYDMVTAGLIALSSGALSTGAGILALERRFAQQRK